MAKKIHASKLKRKSQSKNVVRDFLSQYEKEQDFYQTASQLCKEKIESILSQNGLRAIVSFRVKKIDRLAEKLTARNKKTKYKTIKAIIKDIVDLAGVRVALYFPADRNKVRDLLRENFSVNKENSFPKDSSKLHDGYKKRFSGYWAEHYRVSIKKSDLSGTDTRYANANIEIQVASLLMHAWSEVEHDLVYKPKSGKLSQEELSILDEINGLVITGEIALERLQDAIKIRIDESGTPFGDHYELASYIVSNFAKDKRAFVASLPMGRVDRLYRFLQISKLDRPIELHKFLSEIDTRDTKSPFTQKIVDAILENKPELASAWEQTKAPQTNRKKKPIKVNIENSPTENFLHKWIILEAGLRALQPDQTPVWKIIGDAIHKGNDSAVKIIGKQNLVDLEQARLVRNQLLHGVEIPTADQLSRYTIVLSNINQHIMSSAPSSAKNKIKEMEAKLSKTKIYKIPKK